MSEGKRRTIRQLRALAASTTFPAEAASARAKADKLEAELWPLGPDLTAGLIFDPGEFFRDFHSRSPELQGIYEMLMQEMARQMRGRGR